MKWSASEAILVVQNGLAASTAALYASIMRKFLSELQTLTPTRKQAEDSRDGLLRAGKGRAYVGNVVKALRRYSDFSGHDLRLPMVRERHEEVPEYLTEEELRRLLFACRSAKERLIVQLMRSQACARAKS